MEKQNPTIGKVVSSPTDNAWAQAYSAGKLYIVLSLETDDSKTLAALGRETVEKLQREFFALDQKSLQSIKKAVEGVLSEIPKNITYSCVVSTTVKNAFYICIGGNRYVLLSRNNKTSVIAAGEKDSLSSYSGICESDDVFLLTTEGFLKTIAQDEIQKVLDTKNPHEASEELAVLMHENATGSEAALIIKDAITKHQAAPSPVTIDDEEILKEEEEKNDHLELDDSTEEKKVKIPSFHFAFITQIIPRKFSKKVIIGVAIVALVVLLGGGILFEQSKRQNDSNTAAAQKIISSHTDRYEEALAVMPLNKSLALEALSEIQTGLEREKEQFAQGSQARNKIEEFLEKVNSAMGGNTSSNSPISMFLEPNDTIKTLAFLTNKGGSLTSAGGTTAGIISSNGEIDETFDTDNAKGVSASEDSIFILTSSGVQKIEKSSGETEDIFETTGKSIDTFGDNIYVLEGKTISKYRPNAYAKEAYLTGDATLTDPSSIAIDASIYVVDEGEIKKFTRGAEDSFNYNGPTLSNKSLAYTDEDYANLYVVDPVSQMAYVIDKSGKKVSEFSLKGMKTITGVSAEESNSKMYIAGDGNIYIITL